MTPTANYSPAGSVTVTSHSATRPFTVLARILTFPAFTPTTLPALGVTVAVNGSADSNVTVLSSASEGSTVAVKVSEAPISRDNVDLLSVIFVGTTIFFLQ